MYRIILIPLLHLLLFATTGHSQGFIEFRDTVNGFSVGIPIGWTYNVPSNLPSIKLMAGVPEDSPRTVRENFNINIIEEPNSDINTIRNKFLVYLNDNNDFRLIDSGSNYIEGQQILWLDETHRNSENNLPMFSSVFIIYNNDRAYVLTAGGHQPLTTQLKPLFHQIGSTLKTGEASKRESLKIAVSDTKRWHVIAEGNDYETYFKQLIPVNKTKENWDTLIHQLFTKNGRVDSIHQAVIAFTDASRQQSNQGTITIIKEVDLPQEKWALFKIETPYFPNDPQPESQLWYVLQGEKGFHVAFVAIKEKQLSAAFVSKWSGIFKQSRLVYE